MIAAETKSCDDVALSDLIHITPKLFSTVLIELTNRCNLRCVFCSTGHPNYQSGDMSVDHLDKVIHFCKDSGINKINVSGHGETTAMAGWESVIADLLDQGFGLSMTSNLAKRLSPPQARVLSRFEFIMASIDTLNPEFFKQFRRSADLRNILYNLQIIRSAALSEARKPPHFGITSVLFQENINGFEQILGLAASLRDCGVHINCPIEFDEVSHAIGLTHPMKLRGSDYQSLVSRFRTFVKLARSLNVPLTIDETLLDFLVSGIPPEMDPDGYRPYCVPTDICDGVQTMMRVWSKLPAPGQTRLCLDPWNLLLFERHGRVLSCCIGLPSIADLSSVDSMIEIINSHKARALRRSLLTGELPLHCKCCARKPLVDAGKLQQLVAAICKSR